ncbi:multiubiquitin domain-containing protein [Variovorax sp. J22R115]|uniref:multiubiquitin domain-containing protein n=1 Tax=Variovorax sp. J22R115 TaxID=3053509 RepID=UPI00257518DA|nr:multiubiquitin domain-containing protein [Variovorax sp. J22R115]MDM0053822.1 multiubiquitin domain-containing protein [Variovorax sp. J22R115]
MPLNENSGENAHKADGEHAHRHPQVAVAGVDLVLRSVHLEDPTPTGAQIAQAAGFSQQPETTVLQWFDHGTEDISPTEVAKLGEGLNRFIVAETDDLRRMTIEGNRFDWPARVISGQLVRRLANIPPSKQLYLERDDKPDELLADDSVVDLSRSGVERFVARVPKWQLNVQGELLTFNTPTVVVRDALVQAGFNPDQGWHIFLKVQGAPKEEVQLDSVVDLTRSGIEKLRLTPKDVNNGEGVVHLQRQFKLLSADERYLDANHPNWEAIAEGGQQWLILSDYPLPEGFSQRSVAVALEIPPTYPMAQIDMFYLHPEVTLQGGGQVPATEARVNIRGKSFQRWSRHRGNGSMWVPGTDNVITHLALVESALAKEVQQ